MVEFAIGLPVLLTLLLGFIEVSQLVLAYIVVGQTAHEAARYAITTTVSTPPSWSQYCNRGLDVSIGSGYQQYDATDSTCVGLTNVVSTVTSKSPASASPTPASGLATVYRRQPPCSLPLPEGYFGLEGTTAARR
jgi:Flp pilus assembly protein TadG